jgi:hypothetical protein
VLSDPGRLTDRPKMKNLEALAVRREAEKELDEMT